MNTETLSACLQYQERGAFWYDQASMWRDEFCRFGRKDHAAHVMAGSAIQDQSLAAKLSKADRVLRGVEE